MRYKVVLKLVALYALITVIAIPGISFWIYFDQKKRLIILSELINSHHEELGQWLIDETKDDQRSNDAISGSVVVSRLAFPEYLKGRIFSVFILFHGANRDIELTNATGAFGYRCTCHYIKDGVIFRLDTIEMRSNIFGLLGISGSKNLKSSDKP